MVMMLVGKDSVRVARYAAAYERTVIGEIEVREALPLVSRLWIYTNFDCNLACTYCLTSSSPTAKRRALPPDAYYRLIDEAMENAIGELFLTGGEPLLLPDIGERLTYAATRLPTTLLTNGMLLRGRRLEELAPLRNEAFTLQISLDGHVAEIHDAYRGVGSWRSTVDAIERLLNLGFHVTIGATETRANAEHVSELRAFARSLGVAEDGFFLRPLTKRGLSHEGIELRIDDLAPELTVTAEGVFWHPQSAGEAMLLAREIFPLRDALALMRANFEVLAAGGPTPQRYRCA